MLHTRHNIHITEEQFKKLHQFLSKLKNFMLKFFYWTGGVKALVLIMVSSSLIPGTTYSSLRSFSSDP